MPTTQKLIDTIPTKVKVELQHAIGDLKRMKDATERGRRADQMFGGLGRYESDAVCNSWGSTLKFFEAKDDALAVIEKWRSYIADRQIPLDIDALLEEQGCPSCNEIYISAEGFNYANNL